MTDKIFALTNAGLRDMYTDDKRLRELDSADHQSFLSSSRRQTSPEKETALYPSASAGTHDARNPDIARFTDESRDIKNKSQKDLSGSNVQKLMDELKSYISGGMDNKQNESLWDLVSGKGSKQGGKGKDAYSTSDEYLNRQTDASWVRNRVRNLEQQKGNIDLHDHYQSLWRDLLFTSR